MSFTRRKFLTLSTIVSTACTLPGMVNGALESVGSVDLSMLIADRLLYKRLIDAKKLPTARTCLICRSSIETTGGQKLIYTRHRGTTLAKKSDPFFRENFRGQTSLLEGRDLFLIAWGEKKFMTTQVIDRAKRAYLNAEQPWFCQNCGSRVCHLCGTPLIWLVLGDYAFDDGGRGYYSRGANLGVSPPCTNQHCTLYRDRSEASEGAFS